MTRQVIRAINFVKALPAQSLAVTRDLYLKDWIALGILTAFVVLFAIIHSPNSSPWFYWVAGISALVVVTVTVAVFLLDWQMEEPYLFSVLLSLVLCSFGLLFHYFLEFGIVGILMAYTINRFVD